MLFKAITLENKSYNSFQRELNVDEKCNARKTGSKEMREFRIIYRLKIVLIRPTRRRII